MAVLIAPLLGRLGAATLVRFIMVLLRRCPAPAAISLEAPECQAGMFAEHRQGKSGFRSWYVLHDLFCFRFVYLSCGNFI